MVAIQAIPYGREHTNPPVRLEPNWNAPETRQLVARACYDCHSNETIWPWYSDVAPLSWLVQRDVDRGRPVLNFSEWDRPQETVDAVRQIQAGEMPPFPYVAMHPEANLSAAERQQLILGLRATFVHGAAPRGVEGERRSGERERRAGRRAAGTSSRHSTS